MSSETELAWASGIIEGEGSFTGHKEGNGKGIKVFQPSIAVQMCDLDVLNRLQNILGGRINGPQIRGENRPIYQWHISVAQQVVATCALLEPWLLSRRKNQMYKMLEAYASQRQSEVRTCTQCMTTFEWVFRKGPRPRFCSRRCQARHHNGLPAVSLCVVC